MLAKRLARHGLAVSGGVLASVLSQNPVSACVSTALVSSTVKAASLFVTGPAALTGIISLKVVVLTEGVLKMMLLSKLKIAAAALTLALVVGGAGGLFYRTQAGEGQASTEKNRSAVKAPGQPTEDSTNRAEPAPEDGEADAQELR